MGSILRYIGKRDLDLSKEAEEFRFKTYCEPFSGSYNVGFDLMESGYKCEYILNDLDWEVYNLWRCLRRNPIELYDKIQSLVFGMLDLSTVDNKIHLLSTYKHSSNNLERAAGEYVYRFYTTIKGLKINDKMPNESILKFINQSNMLKNNCKIRNLDYKSIISKVDSEDTFFYIDPPYDIVGVSRYYRCDSDMFYHAELRDYLSNLKGKFIMTYNNSEYISELYKDYYQYVISKNIYGNIYYELLITNYSRLG